jgi:ribosomal protein S18 acetylase RimI-like enzyme
MKNNTPLPNIVNEKLHLEVSTSTHLSLIQLWFTDREKVLTWAGQSFDFPTSNANFIQQLSAHGFTSFSLMLNEDLVGFGQYQLYPPFLHLGRLVINPKHRGNGFAHVLLQSLINEGAKKGAIKKVSLFVSQSNKIAYKVYTKAGFIKKVYPQGKREIEGCDYLTLSYE